MAVHVEGQAELRAERGGTQVALERLLHVERVDVVLQSPRHRERLPAESARIPGVGGTVLFKMPFLIERFVTHGALILGLSTADCFLSAPRTFVLL